MPTNEELARMIDELKVNLRSAVPPGTVTAFAGEVLDTGRVIEVRPGWLLCNGAATTRARFPELHSAIQASHGNGQDVPDPPADFNLPDFRGFFLRGVAGSTGRDPDAEHRATNHLGGNVGNRVGSIQPFATADAAAGVRTSIDGEHQHTVNLQYQEFSIKGPGSMFGLIVTGSGALAGLPGSAHQHRVGSGWDRETRPLNAYVNWIIKA